MNIQSNQNQYYVVILSIIIVTGALSYLKVIPTDLTVAMMSAILGHIAGIPINLSNQQQSAPVLKNPIEEKKDAQ